VREHALLYERKSDIEPVRRKILKREDRFFTELVQVEFYHGGVGGKDFLSGLELGIVDLATLSIIFVNAVYEIRGLGSFGKEEIEFWMWRENDSQSVLLKLK
jgi:hypothetical protein